MSLVLWNVGQCSEPVSIEYERLHVFHALLEIVIDLYLLLVYSEVNKNLIMQKESKEHKWDRILKIVFER